MDNDRLRVLAQEALDVQNACNLSGILLGAGRVCSELRQIFQSSDEAANHPIMRLWADKVAHLAGIQSLGDERVSDAYKAVYAIIGSTLNDRR